MIIKPKKELINDLLSTNTVPLAAVLKDLDEKIIQILKTSSSDIRYVQGYSAAIDDLLSLLQKQ